MEILTPYLISSYHTHHRTQHRKDEIFAKRNTQVYELVYFRSESDCKLILDDQEYHITGDSIVFRRPGQNNQSFMPYESILLKFIFEEPKIDLLSLSTKESATYRCDAINSNFLNQIPTYTQVLHQLDYQQLFTDIYNETLFNREFSQYYYSSKLMEILYALHSETHSASLDQSNPITNETMQTMLKYIDTHITHSFTIQTMSKDLCISESYIYRLFNEHLSITPIHYINNRRLNYSKNLLTNSNLSIYQISEMSGYDTSTYYQSLFKKHFNLTPTQYRKNST